MPTDTEMTRAQRAYRDALAAADAARVALVVAIETQRDEGRTLEDIGDELGIGKSNTHRLLRRAQKG